MAGTDEAGVSFAERMMKNMGWSQGKGLGREEEGMRDFIKPKMKFNTKGIGFMGVDNKWIAHQEHLDELLTSLNKGEKPAEKKDIACLTSSSKLRGRTKFYAKMMRGKDLSNRSSDDLKSIIVPLSKKERVLPDQPETAPLPSELDGSLKSSQVSMNDYFATMMAQRRSKLNGEKRSNEDVREEICIDADDSRAESTNDCEKEMKRKKKKSHIVPEEFSLPCDAESVEESGETKKKKRKSRKVDCVDSSPSPDHKHASDDSSDLRAQAENTEPPKRRSKKTKDASVVEIEPLDEEKPQKKTKKSKKRKSPEPLVEEPPPETHTDDTTGKKKKKKKSKVVETQEAPMDDDDSVQSKKSKNKKSKHKHVEHDFEITEDGTRLNVDVNLLKEIRGSKLAKSKAAPIRDLTDDQIQEIYRLWTSGEYAEFMRRIHAGELPRWVAVEKAQVDRMIMGRAKLIDLADVRELVQSKWKSANVEEIWGYTNVAYLAV